MIQASKAGFLFRTTEAIKKEYPQYPAFEEYDEFLAAIKEDAWSDYAGKIETLGLVSGDDPELNFVQIPMETTQWGDGFTQDDYKALVADMFNGTITVSNDISAEEPAAETATVNFQGNLK